MEYPTSITRSTSVDSGPIKVSSQFEEEDYHSQDLSSGVPGREPLLLPGAEDDSELTRQHFTELQTVTSFKVSLIPALQLPIRDQNDCTDDY